MKRKNAKIWVVVIITVQFLVLCSVMTNANAWKNGDTPSGHVTEAMINTWRTEGHYGTHDGIAEAALDVIKQDSYAQEWKDKDGLDFWDVRRTIIFLIGTEVPDMSQNQVTMTLNEITVRGQRTSRYHNIWFNRYDPGTTNSMKISQANVMNILNEYTGHAVRALRNGECDLAAFYMGATSHFIADLSTWGHTISWEKLKETWDPDYGYNYQEWIPSYLNDRYRFADMVQRIHSRFEADVLKYTKNKVPELFSYPKNFRASPNGIKNPREIAIELAFKTRFDCEATCNQINDYNIYLSEGLENALWMFHHSYKVDWMTNEYVYVNIENQNGVPGLKYREQVQESLNDGVKSVVKLLDYFGVVWNTETSRECKGCVTEKPPEKSMTLSRKLMIGIAMFIYMGIAASFFQTIMLTQLKSAMKKEESELAVVEIPLP